ncbi:HAMP domain-containing protein [Paenibacillus chitinolyticus]|uniref:histidine kinase n=2 Tax=Paenibacillus chitinolyticus TaxID=79263 RepID=A0A410WXJ8_9BACL|nr:HAMP domain-containing protein [Paenibacillus chitinolyticus]
MDMTSRLSGWKARTIQAAGAVPLQTRLIVSYIFIMLIPVVLLSMYLFNSFYESTIREIVKSNESMLEVEKTNIYNHMETMERTAQLIVSDTAVAEYLQSNRNLEVNELLEYRRNAYDNLLRLQFNNPNLAHIRLFTSNANVKEIWPVFFSESRITGQPWYKQVKESPGTVQWIFGHSDPDLTRDTSIPSMDERGKVSLLREVSFVKGQHEAIVQVDMFFDLFFPKTFSRVQDGQSQMMIVDGNGTVHTLYDTAFFRKLAPSGFLDRLNRDASPGGSFEFTSKGTRYLCVYAKLDRLGAFMLNIVSLEEPFSDIAKTRNNLILAMTGLIALLAVTTYFLLSLILKKLHVLQNSMKRVRQGNFHFDIDIQGGGEVGELAHHFRLMLRKINELIVEAVNKQAATKEAELNSLKNQIDSHFMYNTLENLKMMAEIREQYALSDALTSLGGMMRYNLKWTSDYVRLADEIQHIGNYIAVMNIRYDDKLRLQLEIPPEFWDQKLPKMSLQPIVENSVKHGIRSSGGEDVLVITVKARELNGRMSISVHDDGRGMSLHQLEQLRLTMNMEDEAFRHRHSAEELREREGSGIGLRNVNQRVRLYYGREYGLQVTSREGAWTEVVLSLPLLSLTGGG